MTNLDRVPTIKSCRTVGPGVVVLFILCLVLIGWVIAVRQENAVQARRISRLEIDNAALITPPNGIILDPYSGSGSTGKAATLEGFRFIGMEREAEYCTIANSRIAWAVAERLDIANKRIEAERAQLKLF